MEIPLEVKWKNILIYRVLTICCDEFFIPRCSARWESLFLSYVS